jgi:hypothetical protein
MQNFNPFRDDFQEISNSLNAGMLALHSNEIRRLKNWTNDAFEDLKKMFNVLNVSRLGNNENKFFEAPQYNKIVKKNPYGFPLASSILHQDSPINIFDVEGKFGLLFNLSAKQAPNVLFVGDSDLWSKINYDEKGDLRISIEKKPIFRSLMDPQLELLQATSLGHNDNQIEEISIDFKTAVQNSNKIKNFIPKFWKSVFEKGVNSYFANTTVVSNGEIKGLNETILCTKIWKDKETKEYKTDISAIFYSPVYKNFDIDLNENKENLVGALCKAGYLYKEFSIKLPVIEVNDKAKIKLSLADHREFAKAEISNSKNPIVKDLLQNYINMYDEKFKQVYSSKMTIAK